MTIPVTLVAFVLGWWLSRRVRSFAIRHIPDSNFESIVAQMREARTTSWKTKKS